MEPLFTVAGKESTLSKWHMAAAAAGSTAGSVKGKGAGENRLRQLLHLPHFTISTQPATANVKKLESARMSDRLYHQPVATSNTQHATHSIQKQKRDMDKLKCA